MIKLRDLISEVSLKYTRVRGKKVYEAVTEKGTRLYIYPSVEHEHIHDKRSGKPIDREKPIWKAVMYDERGNVSPKFYGITRKNMSGIKQAVERYAEYKNL